MKLVFTRAADGINVTFFTTLVDASNMDENFIIQKTSLQSRFELRLFYAFTKGISWTLNELNYFAICNNLCLKAKDDSDVVIESYGICI